MLISRESHFVEFSARHSPTALGITTESFAAGILLNLWQRDQMSHRVARSEKQGRTGKNPEPAESARTNPTRSHRKRVLLAMGWYVHDLSVGVTRFARDAGWILDDSASHCGVIPPDWSGEGILTVTTHVTTPLTRFVEAAKIPVVDLAAASTNPNFYRVQPDNMAIGRLAADEFLGRGFRNFMFFSSDRNAPVVKERMEGFRRAVERINVPLHVADYTDQHRQGSLDGLIPALGRDLKELPKPLAVMAQYDMDANNVVRAAIEAGLRVPEDVAVIGVDNDLVYSQLGWMPLTSVISNLEEVGFRGAELLDRLMRGERVPKTPILISPGGVMVRNSTDIFASEDVAISKALAFIAGNLEKQITVDDIVRSSGVSRRSLFSKFSQRLGRSIHRELLRQRIAKAKLKLSSSEDKLESIAMECGFSSYTALWSAFRASEGLSPSEFKVTERLRRPSA